MKGQLVMTVEVTDPDTKLPVNVAIYKLDNGAMVGIDESYIANTDDAIMSPYDNGTELNLDI